MPYQRSSLDLLTLSHSNCLKHVILDRKLEGCMERQLSKVINIINKMEANEKKRLMEVAVQTETCALCINM
jgi:hypothetical protein